jgi:hypothetical protein
MQEISETGGGIKREILAAIHFLLIDGPFE